MARWLFSLALVLALAGGGGCDSSDDDEGGGGFNASPCAASVGGLCTQACGCEGDGACLVIDDAAAADAQQDFADRDACFEHYRAQYCGTPGSSSEGSVNDAGKAFFDRATRCGQCAATPAGDAQALQVPATCPPPD